MHCPKGNTNCFPSEEKKLDLCSKSTASRMLRPESHISVWRQLLAASKDAESLIACLFELHFVTAKPLEQIWERLARAIKLAQQALQEQRNEAQSCLRPIRLFRQRGL
jgi:type VI protein secretion system component VasF